MDVSGERSVWRLRPERTRQPQVVGNHAYITEFLLSCRVFGKKVKDATFAILIREARANGAAFLTAIYRPTAKNNPAWNSLNAADSTAAMMAPQNGSIYG